MLLSKIYSNKTLKEIIFKPGLNIVVAKRSGKSSHNLGKSNVVELINYLLLSNWSEESIFHERAEIFHDFVFFLEIQIPNNTYLTIKRPAEKEFSSSISFKIHYSKNLDLSQSDEWDETFIDLRAAQAYLNKQLSFNVLQNYVYRDFVSYFTRKANEYNDVFEKVKGHKKSKDKEWKPKFFDFIGLTCNKIIDSYTVNDQISKKRKLKSSLLEGLGKGYKQELRSVNQKIQELVNKKGTLEESISSLQTTSTENRFYNDLRDIVEPEIIEIKKNLFVIESEIQYFDNLPSNFDSNFDLKSIRTIFEEFRIYFPEKLEKNYQDLIDFNKKIFHERHKYIAEKLDRLKNKQAELALRLRELEDRKREIVSVIAETDLIHKIRSIQESISSINDQIIQQEKKKFDYEKADNYEREIKELSEKLLGNKKKIEQFIESQPAFYIHFKNIFNELCKEMLPVEVDIKLDVKKTANIEPEIVTIDPKTRKQTSQKKGSTYIKIISQLFDIAALISYNTNNFYKFLYHDSFLDGDESNLTPKYLNLIKEKSEKYNFQYICSSIEDYLPNEFNKSEFICLALDDEGESGKLFGISF
jgi:uncharacterized protein YydD (DUF2326 family)